ncbi:Smr/MutS family protein [Flagellimonas nanhaiensis]|uniref:DNA mismatch repair protein MutS n=1 Tax=Flagellimonas nanhaiensis TaxID=2292706 RepID=A0A371JT94_9FLAO|nr:Smr/MutS family protein [Allomuricauda nanhaiensis]RDY61025.1 DNA mismatch repair protein MutS [Allomuricauda nanhaiensis]
MSLLIGDKVEVLDEASSGRVVDIEGDMATVVMDDGFTLKYSIKELIKIEGDIKVSNYEVAKVKGEKEVQKKKKDPVRKPKQRNEARMVVDLHIHQLVKSSKNLSNFDILNLQLDAAKRQLDFAIGKRIQKVVFVHGVGEGILKEELKYLFKKYENLKFYDADYQKYGLGATEVYIFQNG